MEEENEGMKRNRPPVVKVLRRTNGLAGMSAHAEIAIFSFIVLIGLMGFVGLGLSINEQLSFPSNNIEVNQ